jgi:hypothetical protein
MSLFGYSGALMPGSKFERSEKMEKRYKNQ